VTEFWQASFDQTVKSSEDFVRARSRRKRDVADWFGEYAACAPTTSNQGSANLPFQRWFHFKEAFSPKFVADTLTSLPYRVGRCLDPFAGSGTTAVTCRMLGIDSIGVEVNPFLADLIEAKLTPVSPAEFCSKYQRLISNLTIQPADKVKPDGMPPTFAPPGIDGRYVFTKDVFRTARAILRRSQSMEPKQARLLRVLLGSALVQNSNVTINGKGRRYRANWETRRTTGDDLIASLDSAVDAACADLIRFSGLPKGSHAIHRGDARSTLARVTSAEVAIFSPPYPNSFDYTDVYNLELWMLGYLRSSGENYALRQQTLRSHVQTKWKAWVGTGQSKKLAKVLTLLKSRRDSLWNPHIPEMIACYFDDLSSVFRHLARILGRGRHAVVAIGDSQYAGVHIDVASILIELVGHLGFRLVERGTIRSMRNSSQHGGAFELREHCLVFKLR